MPTKFSELISNLYHEFDENIKTSDVTPDELEVIKRKYFNSKNQDGTASRHTEWSPLAQADLPLFTQTPFLSRRESPAHVELDTQKDILCTYTYHSQWHLLVTVIFSGSH